MNDLKENKPAEGRLIPRNPNANRKKARKKFHIFVVMNRSALEKTILLHTFEPLPHHHNSTNDKR